MKRIEEIENELMEAKEELQATKERCAELTEELVEAKKLEETYLMGKELGQQLSTMLKGLQDGGLDEDQSWDLVMGVVERAPMHPTPSFLFR